MSTVRTTTAIATLETDEDAFMQYYDATIDTVWREALRRLRDVDAASDDVRRHYVALWQTGEWRILDLGA